MSRLAIFIAVGRQPIPERDAEFTNLQLFRLGYDTSDIALFRRQSEASVSSDIHILRTRERCGRLEASAA